jgi:AcrR family transcriptional regulator
MEKGLRDVTLAEVCDAAGANAAAVNYHFGGKEELYAAVWRHAFERENRVNPAHGGVPADAPPEERLRGRIRALVRRFVVRGPGAVLSSLMTKELANPTAIFRDLHREAIMPLRRAMQSLIRELLGPNATDRDVLFTEMSVVHQCVAMGLRREFARGGARDPEPGNAGGDDLAEDDPPRQLARYVADENGINGLIDHVTTFSLAGIAALREQIEARSPQYEERTR